LIHRPTCTRQREQPRSGIKPVHRRAHTALSMANAMMPTSRCWHGKLMQNESAVRTSTSPIVAYFCDRLARLFCRFARPVVLAVPWAMQSSNGCYFAQRWPTLPHCACWSAAHSKRPACECIVAPTVCDPIVCTAHCRQYPTGLRAVSGLTGVCYLSPR